MLAQVDPFTDFTSEYEAARAAHPDIADFLDRLMTANKSLRFKATKTHGGVLRSREVREAYACGVEDGFNVGIDSASSEGDEDEYDGLE